MNYYFTALFSFICFSLGYMKAYLNEHQEAPLSQVTAGFTSTMFVNDARTLKFVPLVAPSSSIDENSFQIHPFIQLPARWGFSIPDRLSSHCRP